MTDHDQEHAMTATTPSPLVQIFQRLDDLEARMRETERVHDDALRAIADKVSALEAALESGSNR